MIRGGRGRQRRRLWTAGTPVASLIMVECGHKACAARDGGIHWRELSVACNNGCVRLAQEVLLPRSFPFRLIDLLVLGLGLLILMIIGVMAASQMREEANRIKCAKQLRAIGQSILL